jgi:hypothetical protein
MKVDLAYVPMLALLYALLSAGACARHSEKGGIVIDVRQDGITKTYINGYRKALTGQVISYHSSHPDAESALLVRANKEAGSISWETDPLPSSAEGGLHQLVWLAGIECQGWAQSKGVHRFDFYINGDRWFTFKNLKDSSAKRWSVSGKDGAELSFEAAMADRAGDLFGWMFLKIPGRHFKAGAPLVLQVAGEDAGSLDWYMTFQYTFHFTAHLRAEPVLTKGAGGTRQLLRLSLDNLQEGRSVDISTPGLERKTQPLKIGANVFYLPIAAVDSEREVPVAFSIDGEAAWKGTVNVRPVKQRDFYLLSYSHNDIGYTDLQPAVEKKQWRYLDEALRLIKLTANYPPEARYKWNLEVLWPLESYLERAPEEKRREFLEAVRNGSIGLNALYVNPLTGLADSTEMSHFTGYARRFSEQYSVAISTALVSDIPGFAWGVVPALAQSGVRYFASAPNSGDRIGYVLEQWGDRPFYWTSQSGNERVLMWVAGASYSTFHEGEFGRLGDEKVLKLARKFDSADYPYDTVQLPYTIGGDNGPPDPSLPDFVRHWNERYSSPRLVIATHEQMFAGFEKRYGRSLPSFSGDFTPYWEDGAASTARETTLNRRAADRLIQGEALWSMIAPAAFPEREYEAAWKNVILYDEHTWGAHNSISEPDLPFVKEQWKFKRQFASNADRMSRALLARPLERLTGPGHGLAAIDVYNTLSWPRTDLVIFSSEQSSPGDLVTDEKGAPVPSQRLSTGELAVLAENVPPLSTRRYFVQVGTVADRGAAEASIDSLQNTLLSASIDRQNGAIQSLRWSDRNLANSTEGFGLNEYIYVPGKDPKDARHVTNVRIRIKERGPLLASLLVEAKAPGCNGYTAEYRVVDGIARLDIINRIDKRAVREKEGIHIAWAFHVPEGQPRYDVANGIVRPESDQLPGSCKNFFSVQSWADISNEEHGVTWTTVDAPLIEIGTITAEQPWLKAVRPSQTLFSYVMNNYWHTNYKADQAGLAVFRYSLIPHAAFRPEAAVRSGREAREPLLAATVTGASQAEPPAPLARIDPPEILVSSIRPLPGGSSWLVYLYNPTSQDQDATVEWNKTAAVAMRFSDGFGHSGPEIKDGFKMAAYGSSYIRVDKKQMRAERSK